MIKITASWVCGSPPLTPIKDGPVLSENNCNKTKSISVLFLETSPTLKTSLLAIKHLILRAQAGELELFPCKHPVSSPRACTAELHLRLLQLLGLSGGSTALQLRESTLGSYCLGSSLSLAEQ